MLRLTFPVDLTPFPKAKNVRNQATAKQRITFQRTFPITSIPEDIPNISTLKYHSIFTSI